MVYKGNSRKSWGLHPRRVAPVLPVLRQLQGRRQLLRGQLRGGEGHPAVGRVLTVEISMVEKCGKMVRKMMEKLETGGKCVEKVRENDGHVWKFGREMMEK